MRREGKFYNGIIFKKKENEGRSSLEPFARLSASTPYRQRFRMGGILRRIVANLNSYGGLHPFRPTVHKIAPNGKRSLVIVRNVVYNRNRIPW